MSLSLEEWIFAGFVLAIVGIRIARAFSKQRRGESGDAGGDAGLMDASGSEHHCGGDHHSEGGLDGGGDCGGDGGGGDGGGGGGSD